jgi:hypothetical protein
LTDDGGPGCQAGRSARACTFLCPLLHAGHREALSFREASASADCRPAWSRLTRVPSLSDRTAPGENFDSDAAGRHALWFVASACQVAHVQRTVSFAGAQGENKTQFSKLTGQQQPGSPAGRCLGLGRESWFHEDPPIRICMPRPLAPMHTWLLLTAKKLKNSCRISLNRQKKNFLSVPNNQ